MHGRGGVLCRHAHALRRLLDLDGSDFAGALPLIVDQAIVAAARRAQVRPDYGRHVDGVAGVLLTRAGREAVIGAYERRMLQLTRGALPEFSGSLRRHLYRQAERVAAFIHDPDATWTGLSWR